MAIIYRVWPHGEIIFQYLAIFSNENSPESLKAWQTRFNILANTKQTIVKFPVSLKTRQMKLNIVTRETT